MAEKEEKTDGCRDFLPAAGNRWNENLNNDGSNGYYWSGTLNSGNENNAYNLNFNSNNWNWNNNNRNNGHSVRPVAAFTGVPDNTEAANDRSPSFRLTKEQLLIDIIRAYKDARRHKRKRRCLVAFDMNLEENLVDLRDDLWNRTYEARPSICFIIRDPKVREVFAADFRDRIVHHLYYNYTYECFEQTFIDDSYSCRKGKGTHYGIERLRRHIEDVSEKYKRQTYVLKMDIKGYFMSIDRQRLLDIVLESLRESYCRPSNKDGMLWGEKIDFPFVEYLSRKIIMLDPTEGCIRRGEAKDWDILPPSKSLFLAKKGCGLPIGNLTSQLFSNVYMNVFDKYVEDFLRSVSGEAHYGRYVDDSFVVFRGKRLLRQLMKESFIFLKTKLGLKLHPHKVLIVPMRHGVEFLGAFVKPYRIYVSRKSFRRMRLKIDKLEFSDDPYKIRASLNSFLGILCHYKSYRIRRNNVWLNRRYMRYGYFNRHIRKFVLNRNIANV